MADERLRGLYVIIDPETARGRVGFEIAREAHSSFSCGTSADRHKN